MVCNYSENDLMLVVIYMYYPSLTCMTSFIQVCGWSVRTLGSSNSQNETLAFSLPAIVLLYVLHDGIQI